jgi:hypothetical protein
LPIHADKRRYLLSAFCLVLSAICLYLAVVVRYAALVPMAAPQPIRVPPFPGTFPLPLDWLWLLPLIVAALFVAHSPAGRKVVDQIAGSRMHMFVALGSVAGFLFTFIPLRYDGRSIIAYLSLASTGFMLLLYGSYPVWNRLLHYLWPVAGFLFRRMSRSAFLALTAGFCFALTNLISWLVFRHVPHVSDSTAYVFQGRIFAAGRTWLPAVWDDYFFSFVGIVNDGMRVYSVAPFGHSLLLMLGTLLGAEWIINPLLGSVTVIVLYFLGREVYGESAGRITAVLAVLSPFFLFMSSEYMNHASGLLFTALFLLFFLRSVSRRDRITHGEVGASSHLVHLTPDAGVGELVHPGGERQSASSRRFAAPRPTSLGHEEGRGCAGGTAPLFAGAALAVMINVRPLNALVLAVPAAVYGLVLLSRVWDRTGARNSLLVRFVLIAAATFAGFLLFLGYNYLTTGNALVNGYKVYTMLAYHNANWGLGFGVRGWESWGAHTPGRGLIQAVTNLNALNRHLLESPLPGLLLIVLLFVTFPRGANDWFLLATFLCLPVAYFFYWFQDLCFGPRFLYESLAPVLVLSSQGVLAFPRFLKESAGPQTAERARGTIMIGLILSLTATIFVGLPPLLKFYRESYWGVDDKVQALVQRQRITNAVVFVTAEFSYCGNVWDSYYGAGFLGNRLDFHGPVVYARDRDDENYILIRHFPGRRYYLARPDTFFELTNLDSLSRLPKIAALTAAGDYYHSPSFAAHRSSFTSILAPFREVGVFFEPVQGDTIRHRVPVRSYTEVSNAIFLNQKRLDDYLPALGVFFPIEKRSYLAMFRYLGEGQSFVADNYCFTSLFTSGSRLGGLYDIRALTPSK